MSVNLPNKALSHRVSVRLPLCCSNFGNGEARLGMGLPACSCVTRCPRNDKVFVYSRRDTPIIILNASLTVSSCAVKALPPRQITCADDDDADVDAADAAPCPWDAADRTDGIAGNWQPILDLIAETASWRLHWPAYLPDDDDDADADPDRWPCTVADSCQQVAPLQTQQWRQQQPWPQAHPRLLPHPPHRFDCTWPCCCSCASCGACACSAANRSGSRRWH